MKGIILAGGKGTRLYPATKVVNKHLLPIYNKPMIYYPLSILMMAKIKDILIISTEKDILKFENLLGNGNNLGINLSYKVQQKSNGIAEAFIIGEDFINNDRCALILGDNIFYGNNFSRYLHHAVEKEEGASIFGYYVKDPKRFGVIELDEKRKAISIEEKSSNPKSNYAVTGLYFYDNKVVEYAKQLNPSIRGELEITDLNRIYLENNKLTVNLLEDGCTWLDVGTHQSLVKATNFVRMIEEYQHIKVGCLEEIALNNSWISKSK